MSQSPEDERQSNGQPASLQPPPYWYQQAPAEDEIDLFELWDILWQGRWIILVTGLFCSAVAITYALTATEIYEAKVVMLPADSDEGGGSGLAALAGQFGGLASLAGVNLGGGGGKAEEAKQILKSYAFTAGFIQDKKLLKVLFDEEEQASDQPPTMQDAVRKFDEEIRRISTNQESGATTLSIAWTDPDVAALWANHLVKRLNNHMRDSDVEEAQKALSYLNNALTKTSVVDMQQTLYRLIEAQTQTVMLANVRGDYIFTVIDPAYPPEQRSKPKRSLIVVLGGMLGGMLGVLLVFGRRVVRGYKMRDQP